MGGRGGGHGEGSGGKGGGASGRGGGDKGRGGGGGGSEHGASNHDLTGPLARHRYDLAGSLARPAVSGHTCTTCWCGLVPVDTERYQQQQGAPTEDPGDEDDWDRLFAGIFSSSEIAAMKRDCSRSAIAKCDCSLPPSPPAKPAPPRPALWPLPARPELASIQVSLALVVVCAAFLTELYTSPVFLFAAAGCAVVAILALTSRRTDLARMMTLLVVSAASLRVVEVRVRSPTALARDLDTFADASPALLTLCSAVGAVFGSSNIPSTRKLLVASYYAGAATSSGVLVRVRTGDERMPSFEMLHGFLPFLAASLAAHAASRLRQDASALDSGWPSPNAVQQGCATRFTSAEGWGRKV